MNFGTLKWNKIKWNEKKIPMPCILKKNHTLKYV